MKTPAYALGHNLMEGKGNRLVVSISIHRNILDEVQANLERLDLSDAPLLDVQGEQPVISSAQANVAVQNIKNLINQNLLSTHSKVIHLFYAGPAHLALFLGHRLDGTAPIICYGWGSDRQYYQTCQLFSESHVEGSKFHTPPASKNTQSWHINTENGIHIPET